MSTANASICLRFLMLKPSIWAGEWGVWRCRVPSPEGSRCSRDRSCFFPQPRSQPRHGRPSAELLRGRQNCTTWLSSTAEGDEGEVFLIISSVSAHTATSPFTINSTQQTHGEEFPRYLPIEVSAADSTACQIKPFETPAERWISSLPILPPALLHISRPRERPGSAHMH